MFFIYIDSLLFTNGRNILYLMIVHKWEEFCRWRVWWWSGGFGGFGGTLYGGGSVVL